MQRHPRTAPTPGVGPAGAAHDSGRPTLAVSLGGGQGDTVGFGRLSCVFALSPGEHAPALVLAETTLAPVALFATVARRNCTAFLVDRTLPDSVMVVPIVATHTAPVPFGQAGLRVAQFAAAAPPIDARRTEPNWVALVLSTRPLALPSAGV